MRADLDDSVHLTCGGFVVAGRRVPPFEVRGGEIAALDFGADRAPVELDDVVRAIERHSSVRGGSIRALDCLLVEAPRVPILNDPQASRWLARRSSLTLLEAAGRLRSLGTDPTARLSGLAANPRWLMGFAARMAEHPAVLVYSTLGLDATGIELAFAALRRMLGRTAAVHVLSEPRPDVPMDRYATVVSTGSELSRAAG